MQIIACRSRTVIVSADTGKIFKISPKTSFPRYYCLEGAGVPQCQHLIHATSCAGSNDFCAKRALLAEESSHGANRTAPQEGDE
jgi:hypothetical protein